MTPGAGTAAELISATAMEQTWLRVGDLDDRQILRLQKEHHAVQPALTRFIYAVFPDVGEDAGGVLAYAYHVILQAFREACTNLRQVSQDDIGRVIASLSAREASQPAAGEAPRTSEVHAMQYAVDAFAEDTDVALPAEEVDYCLRMVWIVVEGLHHAGRRS